MFYDIEKKYYLSPDIFPNSSFRVAWGLIDTGKIKAVGASKITMRSVIYRVWTGEFDHIGLHFCPTDLRRPTFSLIRLSIFVDMKFSFFTFSVWLIATKVRSCIVHMATATSFSWAEGLKFLKLKFQIQVNSIIKSYFKFPFQNFY